MQKIDLILGDCIQEMKKIRSESVDLIVTDPPYTSPVKNAFGREVVQRLSDLSLQEYFFSAVKSEWERVLKRNGSICVFCDETYFSVLYGLFYEWKNKSSIIWDKGRIGMGNPIRKQHEMIFFACRESVTTNKKRVYAPTVNYEIQSRKSVSSSTKAGPAD